jgi:hypothetical protein
MEPTNGPPVTYHLPTAFVDNYLDIIAGATAPTLSIKNERFCDKLTARSSGFGLAFGMNGINSQAASIMLLA